jgi:hypothetical protein
MQVPPPRPMDYGQVRPPAEVEPAPPDRSHGDLAKTLRAAGLALGSDEPARVEIERSLTEGGKTRDELRAATDELNEDKGRAVLDRRAERRR